MQKHICSAVPEATWLFVIKAFFHIITERVIYLEEYLYDCSVHLNVDKE